MKAHKNQIEIVEKLKNVRNMLEIGKKMESGIAHLEIITVVPYT